ncbi:MAG: hypothetical protein EPN91_06545 [Salinibacterium sp.]|nr:MAG: hypothetical protein EPN91_06545 [Salinibacterium sp.]
MTTRVFYEEWQMQCCGTPFSVGDSVSWTAIPAGSHFVEDFGSIEGADIAWYEEHHQEPGTQVERVGGMVVSIRAIRQEFGPLSPDDKVLVPVAGAVLATDLSSANGWESESDDPAHPDYLFSGYVVTLE